ncbi:hypothetical protein F5144DRAFT_148452 [Chaetomium tenue]|uniref:Uncharacterized protein n=1 Tax=Chaetomium tenue TaxID=1854479 RepID=A0ACB7PJ10_9PEZI|nr:hypothetical protein F5144DRAFT_148452 [Chaetomium globosum]
MIEAGSITTALDVSLFVVGLFGMLEPTGCLGVGCFWRWAEVAHTVGNTLAQSGVVCLKSRKTVAWGGRWAYSRARFNNKLRISIYSSHQVSCAIGQQNATGIFWSIFRLQVSFRMTSRSFPVVNGTVPQEDREENQDYRSAVGTGVRKTPRQGRQLFHRMCTARIRDPSRDRSRVPV